MGQARPGKPSWLERYRVSRAILGQSFRLLSTMRSFWVFPLISLGVTAGALSLAVAAIVGMGGLQEAVALESWFVLPLVFLLLFPLMVLVALLNSALCYGFYRQLIGSPVSPRRAWRRARSQVGPVSRFTMVAGPVGRGGGPQAHAFVDLAG